MLDKTNRRSGGQQYRRPAAAERDRLADGARSLVADLPADQRKVEIAGIGRGRLAKESWTGGRRARRESHCPLCGLCLNQRQNVFAAGPTLSFCLADQVGQFHEQPR
jgi:hypothetical protein